MELSNFKSVKLNSKLYYIAIILVIVGTFMIDEVEGRRKILRGRKTITRSYYRPPLLPAWAQVLLIGIGGVGLGAALYIILLKFVIETAGADNSSEKSQLMSRRRSGSRNTLNSKTQTLE